MLSIFARRFRATLCCWHAAVLICHAVDAADEFFCCAMLSIAYFASPDTYYYHVDAALPIRAPLLRAIIERRLRS